jgi:hypothetical protein
MLYCATQQPEALLLSLAQRASELDARAALLRCQPLSSIHFFAITRA